MVSAEDLRTYQVAYSETWPEELRRTVRRFRDVAYNVNDVFGQRTLGAKHPGGEVDCRCSG